MATVSRSRGRIRAGVFDVDLDGRALYKNGVRVPLQDQPFRILSVLLERPGEVVTREELQSRLWQADSFGAFDEGINTAIRKLRIAFGDSAEHPRFIETIPRRGYRFAAPVSNSAAASSPEAALADPADRKETGEGTTAAAPKRRFRYYAATLLAILLLIVGALMLLRSRSQPPTQMSAMSFVRLTNDGQGKLGPLATDGTRIFFTELLPGQIWSVVQVSTTGGDVVPLPTPFRRPRVVDLSPDRTMMLLASEEHGDFSSLWIEPITGGSPRRVGSTLAYDATWGPDGETIAYSDRDGISLTDKNGAFLHKLFTLTGEAGWLEFSPDGQRLRFNLRNNTGSGLILDTSVDGNNPRNLIAGCCGKWSPDGRYFVFQNATDGRTDLWALREADNERLSQGERQPVQLTAGPLDFEAPTPSKDGKEVFAIGTLRRSEIVRYDLPSGEFIPYLPGVSAEGLSFSRDARWVTYTGYPDGTLWRSNVDGSDRRQLTFAPMRVLLPRWSPDGRQIAFMAHFPGRPWNIYLMPSEGGTPKQLLPDAADRADPTWSPDGNSLAFGNFANLTSGTTAISVLDLKTGQVTLVPGSDGLFSPRWSPDGRYLCAMPSSSPHNLMLFDFATRIWIKLSDLDVAYPSWSQDGRYIYFEDSNNRSDGSGGIDRIRLGDRKLETLIDLKKVGRPVAGTIVEWSGVAPDGSPLLARDISTQEIYALQWKAP